MTLRAGLRGKFGPTVTRLTHAGVLAGAVLAWVIGSPTPASAQGFSVIRDTEIENTLAAYGKPLFEAGNIPPQSVTIRLINDDSINAFVTQGQMMFFHTGLLLVAKTSNEVIGVMAHETGHIAGGHAATFGDQIAAASTTALLATLLGVAAGVASGNPDVGVAMALGGQGSAMRMLFAFSRGQESSADQFAIKVLNATEQSPRGLYEFFNRLAGQELLITDRQDPYVRTHPLTRERMSTVRNAVEISPFADKPPDPALEREHHRMVAKLFAFLKPQITTLQKYPETDKSAEARYAQSIAYYRRGQLDKALPLIDGLIAEDPKDPYYWELKGQMLLENSRVAEAVTAYRQSVRLLPNAPLILVSMAHAMVETGDPEFAKEAQAALALALRQDPDDPFAWDLAAKSYLQSDQPGMSAYAAAERALLLGQFGDVVRYSRDAEKLLEKDTPTWYRLQDIKVTAQNSLQELMDKRRR
ncbi:MAG: M48 family metallopeptidase [Rhodospirillaceae bacterium]|nr:M48 family metallopeptidase [Rhodospirillaceae bacterium]